MVIYILKLVLKMRGDSYVDVRFSSLVFSLLSRLFIILAVVQAKPSTNHSESPASVGAAQLPMSPQPPRGHTEHSTHATHNPLHWHNFILLLFFCSLTITTTLLQFISKSFLLHYNHNFSLSPECFGDGYCNKSITNW